jgi:hypothetical protein
MAGFDLQSAYAQQQDPDADAPQDQSQQQGGLTIPADVAAQIAQAIQSNDCQTVCKLMAAVISQGQ